MRAKVRRISAAAGGKAADELFHIIRDRQFGRTRCFLCGRRLNKKTRTREHVIPLWAQKRFALFDQKLTLLNGTTIRYRDLTIPCCLECNAKHLKPLEDKVAKASLKGSSAVASLGELTLFLWLGKIFYGLLYKELLLVRDRSSDSKKAIIDKKLLKRFDLHQVFLQAARLSFEFGPALPASIFVFKMAEANDKFLQWDLRDSLLLMTVACRIGNVGMLAALQDGGAQRDSKAVAWKKYQQLRLQPLHFVELTAAFFYAASLMNRIPRFMITLSTPILVLQNPLQGSSLKPIFDEWDQRQFAKVLSAMTGFPLEFILRPNGAVASWLHDERGKVELKSVPGLHISQLRVG